MAARRIPLDQVQPYENQPRKKFDKAALGELAQSIREVGQVVPAVVRPVDSGFELIDGERRWRACRLAGKRTLLAVVDDQTTDENVQFRRSIAANFGRADHTPLEIARAVARLRAQGLTLEQAAGVFGKSTASAAMYASLNDLSLPVQKMLDGEQLSPSVARLIAKLPPDYQTETAQAAVSQGWGVYETKRAVHRVGEKHKLRISRPPKPSDDRKVFAVFVKQLEEHMQRYSEFREPDVRRLMEAIPEHRLQWATRLESVAGDLMLFAELVEQTVRVMGHERARSTRSA